MLRLIARFISMMFTILIISMIFQLTEMTPEQTSSLSNAVEGLARATPAASEASDVSVTALFMPTPAYAYDTDMSEFKQTLRNAAGLTPREFLAKLKAQLATLVYGDVSVRQWAHVAEFGALGLSAASMFLAWLVPPRATRRRLALAYLGCLVFCVANSVFDQLHKLYVPGREFDVRDLFLDLAGYGIAVTAVFAVYALGSRLRRRRMRGDAASA